MGTLDEQVTARHIALADLIYSLAESVAHSGDFHPCLADDLGDLSHNLRDGKSLATGEAFLAAFRRSELARS